MVPLSAVVLTAALYRSVPLAHAVFGHAHKPPPLLILHGLFGSGRNWRSLAARLAEDTHRLVYTVDARNHGDSPHTPELSYELMTSDLVHFCHTHSVDKAILLGHSMGGKTAMYTALHERGLVDRLVVVDSSPAPAPGRNNTAVLLTALQQLDLSTVNNAREANTALQHKITDKIVREFLLTNLTREPKSGRLSWKVNLNAIQRYMESISSELLSDSNIVPYDGQALFLGGERSKELPAIMSLFPAAQVRHIAGAGHWVHFEQPLEFLKQVTRFINNN